MAALGIGKGDEVITPPNSFVASTAAIVHLGAIPVFADVRDDQNIAPSEIRRVITSRTKAIMPVHLTGRVCEMDEISAIASEHGLLVIEDSAQAIGSRYNGAQSGTIGDAGCFSTHPLKNLNAAGDGGFVVVKSDAAADRIRLYRNHGLRDRNTVEAFGSVSRMDTLQAAILRMRLRHLPKVIERRRQNARIYQETLDPRHVFVPPCRPQEFNTFHVMVIQVDRRDELQRYLAEHKIGTSIHYPLPIHLQPATRALGRAPESFAMTERQAGRILSLPVNQFTKPSDIERIAHLVNAFFDNKVITNRS
jgi:dTDP-4-amino-4,6-dideoxygalactose transaminase